MSNSMTDYVDNFRANLPNGVTFDSTVARYFYNGKRFPNEWGVERYVDYIRKTPTVSTYAANNISPSLIADFTNDFYGEF